MRRYSVTIPKMPANQRVFLWDDHPSMCMVAVKLQRRGIVPAGTISAASSQRTGPDKGSDNFAQFLADPAHAHVSILYNLEQFAGIVEALSDVTDVEIENRFRAILIFDTQQTMASPIGLQQIIGHAEALSRAGNYACVVRNLTFLIRSLLPIECHVCANLQDVFALIPLRPYFGIVANCFLSCGKLSAGWLFYEATKSRALRDGCRPFSRRFWNGESLASKTLLVWRNPGPGDEVLYASTFADLSSAGARLIIEADSRLVPLFARSFPSATVVPRTSPPDPRTQGPDIDFQTTYGAACRFFRDRLEKFPKHRGFLVPDADRVAHWRSRLRDVAGEKLCVGFTWRSSDRIGNAPFNTEILDWAPMLRFPNVQFFRLQYDECDAELELARQQLGVDIADLPGIDLFNDLDDLAALTAALDLVIGINNVVLNLAGAVGTRAFELGPRWSHFYLGQLYSPWFPSATIYPRDEPLIGTVMARMASDLARLCATWPD